MSAPLVALRSRVTLRLARAEDDDARVHDLIAAGGLLLAALARKLADGAISKHQFIQQATALLQQRAQTAARIGGAALPDATVDDLIDDEALDGYADDVASGAASLAQAAARAGLWLGLAWAAYQTGKTLAAPDDAQWEWRCKDDEASCDGCTANADGGPYSRDDLPGYPADGGTSCGSNCRCSLRMVS